MELDDLEGIAERAYRDAGLDADKPHVTQLARALLGENAIHRGDRPVHGPAALYRVNKEWRIVLARSLPPLYAVFAVGHELGHWLLRRAGYAGDDEEAAADYLGAALIAPRRAFVSARRALGADIPALAAAFSMTQTGAALRLGEAFGTPLAVVSPRLVRVRGPETWTWPDEPTVRRWARAGAPGVRTSRLTDDPRRVLIDADDDATA
ncbi:MAG: hypothetical protein JWP97_5743 [Labilithrix sp.]|nr:hypothetical protein [Labilithrix sp.]